MIPARDDPAVRPAPAAGAVAGVRDCEPGRRRRLGRRIAAVVAAVSGSVLGLYLTLRPVRLVELRSAVAGVRPVYLVAGVAVILLGYLCMTRRSQLLLRPVHRFTFAWVFRSVFVAYVGNVLIPFRAGELVRVHYLARLGDVPHGPILAVVVLERLLDLCCVVLLAVAVLPLVAVELPGSGEAYALGALAALALVLAVVTSRRPSLVVGGCRRASRLLPARLGPVVSEKVERLAWGLSGLASVRTTIAVVGWSFGFWLSGVAAMALWLRAFELSLAWYAPVVALLFVCLGVAVPTSTAHVGTYHFFLTQALLRFGVDATQAAAFAFVAHASGVMTLLVFGIVLLAVDLLRGRLPLALLLRVARSAPPASDQHPPPTSIPEAPSGCRRRWSRLPVPPSSSRIPRPPGSRQGRPR